MGATTDDLMSFAEHLEQEQQQEEQQKRRLMLMSPRMPPKPKPPMHTLHVGRPVPQSPSPAISSSTLTAANRNLFQPAPLPPKRKEGGVDDDTTNDGDDDVEDDHQNDDETNNINLRNQKKKESSKKRAENINSSLGMLKHLAKGTGTVPEMKVTSSLFDV